MDPSLFFCTQRGAASYTVQETQAGDDDDIEERDSSQYAPPTRGASFGWRHRVERRKREGAIAVKKFFGWWADLVYYHAYWSILITILVSLLLGTGLIPGYPRWIEGADRLYALQSSAARSHGRMHSVLFKESRARLNYVIVSAVSVEGELGPEDIFSEERSQAVDQIDKIIRGDALDPLWGTRVAISAKNTAEPESLLTYEDLCRKITLTSGLEGCEPTLASEVLRTRREQGPTEDMISVDGFLVGGLATNEAAPSNIAAFVPSELFIGGQTLRPCSRRLPPSLQDQLATRKLPPTMINLQGVVNDVGEPLTQMSAECLISARAVMLTYALEEGRERQSVNEDWEAVMVAVLRRLRHHWRGIQIDVNAMRSRGEASTGACMYLQWCKSRVDDELRSSTSRSGDAVYVAFTFFALLGYTILINFSCDLFQAKSLSGIAGTFAAVLGLISGMGLCCHLRLALVPTALVCPFLILGIGVDDMLVLLNAYAMHHELADQPSLRCKKVLEEAGISITVTTITSLISFAVGSWSPYLAIRNFCVFCGAGLLFGFFFVLTFFFPFLCLDAQREVQRRLSCCGLLHPSAAAAAAAANKMPLETHSSLASDKARGHITRNEPIGNVGRHSRAFLMAYYGPWLLSPSVKAVVSVFFLVLVSVSTWGISRLELGLDLGDLAPMSSYVRSFDTAFRTHFDVYDLPTDVFFPTRETPWWSPGFLKAVERLEDDLVRSKVARRVINPMAILIGDAKYKTWLLSNDKRVSGVAVAVGVCHDDAPGGRQTFESSLHMALTDPTSRYYAAGLQRSFLFEGKELRAWKMTVLPPSMRTSKQHADWMVAIRRACARHSIFPLFMETPPTTGAVPRPVLFRTIIVPWNFMMIFYESDLRILYFVVREMSVAGGTLVLVALTCLPDWRSGVLVTSIMAMIDISILGFMYFWGIKLNMVSMVNLLISIGFAVDYSTHIAHTFLECRAPEPHSKEKRAIQALGLMGNPVIHGAVASLLGVAMLKFSESTIFNIFFQMMTLIVVFGLAYGVILLPVLLSIVGSPRRSEEPLDDLCDNGSSGPLPILLGRRDVELSDYKVPVTAMHCKKAAICERS